MGAKYKRAQARLRHLTTARANLALHAFQTQTELERVRYYLTRRVDDLLALNKTLSRAADRIQRIERSPEHDGDIMITHRISKMELERGIDPTLLVTICVERAVDQILKGPR